MLLERRGQLKRIKEPVNPDQELAAISDRVIGMGGPGLLFENVIGSDMPVAINLLGTIERVAWSMGLEKAEELEGTIGKQKDSIDSLIKSSPYKHLYTA